MRNRLYGSIRRSDYHSIRALVCFTFGERDLCHQAEINSTKDAPTRPARQGSDIRHARAATCWLSAQAADRFRLGCIHPATGSSLSTIIYAAVLPVCSDGCRCWVCVTLRDAGALTDSALCQTCRWERPSTSCLCPLSTTSEKGGLEPQYATIRSCWEVMRLWCCYTSRQYTRHFLYSGSSSSARLLQPRIGLR